MINIENLNPFPKFCCSIGMIPTSYKVSLTYEEQLLWFCDFLENTVIPTVNNNGQAVEELQNLFVTLTNYVDNYFDNLDVQTEINNKLDDMAENGTLQEIINSYLQIKSLITFDTVNDMKNSSNLINGSYALTYGYQSLNDGGKSYYKIRNITNNDVIDNTHIIPLNNNQLIAELINPFEINPENCVGANDNEKMQNAINYAQALYNDNAPVIINLNRIFTITQTLAIETNITRMPFIFNTNNGGGFKKITSGLLFDTTKTYVSDIYFENISFISNNGAGLLIMESPKFLNIHFLSCTFKNVDKCVYSDTYIQSFTFDNCTITGGDENFIEFAGSYYLNINNCVIEHRRYKYLIYQNYNASTQYNKQFYTNITNNIIEGFSETTSGFIHITSYELINICNNYFESLWNVIVHDCKAWGGNLNIENNRLQQGSSITNTTTNGLLKMLPYSGNIYRMGNINFKGNKINNVFAIYFNSELIAFNDNNNFYKLFYSGNDVTSSNTTSFAYNNRQTSAHFNILPIFSNEGSGTSKYLRTFWFIDGLITWNETIEADNNSQNVYYNFQKGLMKVNSLKNAQINTTSTNLVFYFGFDVYLDDIYSVSTASQNCQVLSYIRQGGNNSKCLHTFSVATTQSNKDIYATVLLNGTRG